MLGRDRVPEITLAGGLDRGAFPVAFDEQEADGLELHRPYRVGGPRPAQPCGVHLVDEGLLRGQEHPLRETAFMDHRDQVGAGAQFAAQTPGDGDDPGHRGPSGRPDGAHFLDGALHQGVEQRLAIADMPVDRGDRSAQLGGQLAHGEGFRAVLPHQGGSGLQNLFAGQRRSRHSAPSPPNSVTCTSIYPSFAPV